MALLLRAASRRSPLRGSLRLATSSLGSPKHGSWLNMAEIEIGVAQQQCLDRRNGDQAMLQRELEAWSQKRNAAHCGTDWQFTTEDARIKLKRLYFSTLLT